MEQNNSKLLDKLEEDMQFSDKREYAEEVQDSEEEDQTAIEAQLAKLKQKLVGQTM